MPQTPFRRTLVVAAACVIVASAWAGPPRSRNAATRYERAIERMRAITDADWDTVYDYYMNPAAPPPPGVQAMRARLTRTLDDVVRGSRLDVSAYDLDFEQGYQMLLPHLAPMRKLAKLMRHDVIVRLNAGDTQGATERLAAMYRMSRHPPDDGTMISSLVGMAMFNLAEQTADIAMAQGMLGDREYGILLDATDDLGGDDPFGVGNAVAGERVLGADWLRGFGGAEDREKLAEALGWSNDRTAVDAVMNLDERDFRGQIDEYEDVLGRIEIAFADPDPAAGRAALEEVEREIESGAVGPLVRLLLPSFPKFFDQHQRTKSRLKTRRHQLAELATGRRDPRSLINAAYLYHRAANAIGRIDPESLAAVRAYARGEAADVDVVRRTLDAAAPILAQLDEASRIDRCDFDAVRPGWAEHRLFATPIVGLADAGALLIADAIGPPADKDRAARVRTKSLATCLRMAGHLSRDDALLASLLSQSLFRRTVKIAVEYVEPDDARALVDAAARLTGKDAFGFERSLAAAANAATRWVSKHVTPPDPPTVRVPTTTRPADDKGHAMEVERQTQRLAKFWATIEARVKALNGDEIFCLLAHREHAAVLSPPVPPAWGLRPFPGDPIPSLADVIDRTEFESIAAQSEETTARLELVGVGLLFGAPAPKPADVVTNAANAGADLRAGRRSLRKLAAVPEPEPEPIVAGDGGD